MHDAASPAGGVPSTAEGMPSTASARDGLPPAAAVSPEELARLLTGPAAPLLLDVREEGEEPERALPGAVLIPLGRLAERLDEVQERAAGTHGSIVVYCRSGARSTRALEILEAAGFTAARQLTGGIEAWSTRPWHAGEGA